jgi:cell division protein FtsZ
MWADGGARGHGKDHPGAQRRRHGVRHNGTGRRDRHGRRAGDCSLASELGADGRRRDQAFKFEGKKRHLQAERGLEALRDCVDTIITIPNERLLTIIERATPLTEAFATADDVLGLAIQNFGPDSRAGPDQPRLRRRETIMSGMGFAMMGTGVGEARIAPSRRRGAPSQAAVEGASVTGAAASSST